jgi:protein phosphatase
MFVTQKLDVAAQTDLGLLRRINQDSFGSDDELGLYVVCDGMGGAAGGEIASHLACETFLAIARQELENLRKDSDECTRCSLTRAVAAANRAVLAHAAMNPALRGMGSTLIAARLNGNHLTLINVGDSRAYLVRSGVATQLTDDHSWVAEQVRLGTMTESQAERSSLKSVITRAIGVDTDVQPDLFETTLTPGDTLLLTSDGLTRHVADAEIAALLTANTLTDTTCHQLIELAKERGGSDNITCILLRPTS